MPFITQRSHTHTYTHFCPQGSVRWAREPAPVFHLAFPKQTREVEAKRDRERNYETRSQHSFQFNGRCSMSCFDKEWIWAPILSTISFQQMTYGTVVGPYEGLASKNVRVSVLRLKHYLELISHLEIFWPFCQAITTCGKLVSMTIFFKWLIMMILEWISSQADKQSSSTAVWVVRS